MKKWTILLGVTAIIALPFLYGQYFNHWSSEARRAKTNFENIWKIEHNMDTIEVKSIMGKPDNLEQTFSNKGIMYSYNYTTNTNGKTFISVAFDSTHHVSRIYVPKILREPYWYKLLD